MNIPKQLKTVLFATSLFIGMGAIAQTPVPTAEKIDVSDTELTQFATVYKEIQVVTAKAQEEMTKTVEDNGFEVERFNTLYVASQNPEKPLEATPEEVEKLEVVMTKIEKMQPVYQKKMETVITKENMSVERYQEVAMAVQTDTELQQRLQAKLQ